MKVAIYARYSSDNQRDASIADQLRICREFAGRQGWTIVRSSPTTRSPALRCCALVSRL
jgi:DNA invertase Pin-like site-specific DNA recombinase